LRCQIFYQNALYFQGSENAVRLVFRRSEQNEISRARIGGNAVHVVQLFKDNGPLGADLPCLAVKQRFIGQSKVGADLCEAVDVIRQADFVELLDNGPVAGNITQAQAGQPPGASAVVISADRNVKYDTVVKVMDRLQRAGVQRVGLSVQIAK